MDPSIFLYIHPFRYRYDAMGYIYYNFCALLIYVYTCLYIYEYIYIYIYIYLYVYVYICLYTGLTLYIHPFRYRDYAMGYIYCIYVKFEPPPLIRVGAPRRSLDQILSIHPSICPSIQVSILCHGLYI